MMSHRLIVFGQFTEFKECDSFFSISVDVLIQVGFESANDDSEGGVRDELQK